MKVLICGDRNYKNLLKIENALLCICPLPTHVIQGECEGADLLGKAAAIKFNIPVMSFPAYWDKYGRAAGPIRNKQMLVEGQPDLVLAFHDNVSSSRGTKNMIRQALTTGIKVYLYEVEGNKYFTNLDQFLSYVNS